MAGLEPWRTSRQTLTSVLGYGLKSGQYSDVGFLVGPDKIRINAHKNILMLRSEVFEAMFSEKWTEGGTTVELDKNHPEAFQAFLEFVYTDELNPDVPLDILFEVMSLGKMYEFPILVTSVAAAIFMRMQPETCVKIYEYTKLLENGMGILAMDMMKKNIKKLVKSEAYLVSGLYTHWGWETWKDLLSEEGYDIREIDLFKGLARWVDNDSDRKAQFDQLIQLIRFPLMGCDVFRSEVVPTELLPKDDVIKMFLFFTEKDCNHTQDDLKYPFRSRFIISVSDSAELGTALEEADDGDVIQLKEGKYLYSQPFEVQNNFLTIRGHEKAIIGPSTKTSLHVTGNNCTLDGIHFKGDTSHVLVTGDNNLLQNLRFHSVKRGLRIKGDSNVIKSTIFTDLHGLGIKITGDDNVIDGLQSTDTDTTCILEVAGNCNCNKILNVNYISKSCSDIDNRVGVIIKNGTGHQVEGLTSVDEYSGDTLLQIESETERVSVTGVKSGMEVLVDGKSHRLKDVAAKNKIQVDGSGHKFENCQTEEWEVLRRAGHSFVGCNFTE